MRGPTGTMTARTRPEEEDELGVASSVLPVSPACCRGRRKARRGSWREGRARGGWSHRGRELGLVTAMASIFSGRKEEEGGRELVAARERKKNENEEENGGAARPVFG